MILINIISGWFVAFIFLFITAFSGMITFMIGYLSLFSIRSAEKQKWNNTVSLFIEEVIFSEPGHRFIIPGSIHLLLNKKRFRCFISAEIINIKRSLSGDAGDNLIRLYKTLNLDKDALQKLSSKKWHIKAQAVKELAVMEQKEYTKNIFRLTNHPHELLRIEAQCALVDLYGFDGLRFLNVTLHPLSQWQQVLLLHKLPLILPEKLGSVVKWLASPEDTITIFALRLVSRFKCYELHNTVVTLLDHNASEVRNEAVKCLQQIFTEETSQDLLNHSHTGNKQYELLLMSSLQGYNPDLEAAYLMQQLGNPDDDIKFSAAKILTDTIPGGPGMLTGYSSAGIAPWKNFITQFKSEKAA